MILKYEYSLSVTLGPWERFCEPNAPPGMQGAMVRSWLTTKGEHHSTAAAIVNVHRPGREGWVWAWCVLTPESEPNSDHERRIAQVKRDRYASRCTSLDLAMTAVDRELNDLAKQPGYTEES